MGIIQDTSISPLDTRNDKSVKLERRCKDTDRHTAKERDCRHVRRACALTVTAVCLPSLRLIRATVCRPLDPDLALACAMALHPRLGRASQLAALGGDLMLHLLEDYRCGVPRVWL